MPYLFSSPETNGHGSFRAAVGAVLAEVDPNVHYFYAGRDVLASELASELWKLVVQHETTGEVAEAITFARSTGAIAPNEFTIHRRDDAKIYIVTDDEVLEAGAVSAPVSWPESRSNEEGANDTAASSLRRELAFA